MRKPLLFMLLCCTFLLCGCSDLAQVEDLAFAEILGVDMTADGAIEVTIEVPKITGQRGESGSGSGVNSPNLIYSALGETFDEALNLLQWAVPRRLDLSQIKLIVVSEALAGSDRFAQAADTIMATPRLYTAARLAVCTGSAKEFVRAEEPVIGTRLASELTATFDDYIRNGFIPDASFADYYYNSKSVYSDSLAIHAETAPRSEPSPALSEDSKAASTILPGSPNQSGVEMQHSNRFLGAAVFRKNRLVGSLSGEDYLYCKILRGESQTFPFRVEGKTVGLATMGTPDIRIDTDASPVKIDVTLRLSIVSSSRGAPVERLEKELTRAFRSTIEVCRTLGAEPFNWAGRAAGSFLTLQDWQAFDWTERFLESAINIDVQLIGIAD